MSKTVAIICEYNPFHYGHLHQIESIRNEFGQDSCIIAIMSGNYTQRGEIAIADKGDRAKAAVACGADIVLELPFPFSISSAELFASAGVGIANALGVVDILSFGSECADIAILTRAASAMLTDKYEATLAELIKADSAETVGYPAMCQAALEKVAGDSADIAFTPNNILAIEYIKALIRTDSCIKPHTIKRVGADYNEERILDSQLQSATAIRKELARGNTSALDYIPNGAKDIFSNSFSEKTFPCDESALDAAVIASLRLSSSAKEAIIADSAGGLYNRLRSASMKANSIHTLVTLAQTKKFTKARIRRVMWYSLFGVTSSDIKEELHYTQLLAASLRGRTVLKEIRKKGHIPVLTKPSDTDVLCDTGKRQKERADRADSVFQLTKPMLVEGFFSVKFTPYIEK